MIESVLFVAALGAALVAAARGPRSQGRRRVVFYLMPVGLMLLAVGATPGGLAFQKLLGRLIMPAGLLWALLLATMLLLLHIGRSLAAGWLLLFLSLYSTAGNAEVGAALLSWLERDYREPPPIDAPPLDALLVLGGGTSLRPWGGAQLGPAGDRVMTAARMYHRGEARHIICSGTSIGGLDQPDARDLGAEAREILTDLGVPAKAITVVPGPRNTKEEIARYAVLMQEPAWRDKTRVGMLTSAWHLRRAMRQADRAGLSVLPVAADFKGDVFTPRIMAMIPSGNGFYRTKLAMWEIIGAAVGR